jgi:hypothetical protein
MGRNCCRIIEQGENGLKEEELRVGRVIFKHEDFTQLPEI